MWMLATMLIVLLFLFYLYLEWYSKKQLIKLLEGYDENNNRSREGGEAAPGRDGKKDIRTDEPEPIIERDVEPEAKRVLPSTDIITPSKNKRKPRNNVKEKIEL